MTALEGLQTADIDDPAPLPVHHAGQRGLGAQKGRVQVGGKNASPILIAHIDEGLMRAGGGIVDHNIDVAKLGQSIAQ